MGTTTQALALGRKVLALVKQASPKAEALVTVWQTHRAHTRFARNEITTAGENDELAVALQVQLGLRSASAQSNQTDAASLAALVSRTLTNAQLSPELPETMLVLAGDRAVLPARLHDPAMARLDARARAEGIRAALAPSLERELSAAGYLEVHDGLVVRLTSAGLERAAPYTDATFSVTARTKDATGSGWHVLSTRQRSELDFARVGRVAAEKAVASAKPRSLEPGRYTVVLEPAAAGELFEYFTGALDRRALDEQRSCFMGKVGAKVISERLTLTSDPRTTPMLPFDGEGLALAPRTWVKAGVLQELRISRFWARKQGLTPTGSYDGCEVLAGDTPRTALLGGVKRGVLITRLWYSNLVDPRTLLITGLTRDGTFLIEDGAIAAPVRNFRINQSVLDALAGVDAVSTERESPGASAWKLPALRTHDFLLASQSDAV